MNTHNFTKPYILVTRTGENNTNNPYLNPTQRYYEFEHMSILFRYAARYLRNGETALTALHIFEETELNNEYGCSKTTYFHDFPTALQEYRDGIRTAV